MIKKSRFKIILPSIILSKQKIILITGATRGLGRAMAEEFIRLGHVVLGCGRSAREIAQLQKQFPAPNDFTVVDVAAQNGFQQNH